MKQLRREYSDKHIVSNEQLEKLKKALISNVIKEVPQP